VRLGLVTYNIAKDWSVDQIIDALSKARFEAVELRSTHAHGVEPGLEQAKVRQVRDRFAAGKVRLLSLGSACEYHSPDAAVREKNVEETKAFLELAHDLGCWGVKVRPNGLPDGVPEATTIGRIGEALRACGVAGERFGVEVWVEVHGRQTQEPRRMRAIMDACGHPNVGVCWNCNPTDIQNGSIRDGFDLLKDYIRNVHIHDLIEYPYRELFSLLRSIRYERYLLLETQSSCEPERFLANYHAHFHELLRF
jgi:sugar phosphate isomerase/epimerase